MRTYHFLAAIAATLIFSTFTTVSAADDYTLIGQTESTLMGKTETRDSLLLEVTPTDAGLSIHLDKFELAGHKNLSITGLFSVDGDGTITDWKDIIIKGAPAKVKKITGTLSKNGTDVIMTGKAGGLFNFTVHFTAPAL